MTVVITRCVCLREWVKICSFIPDFLTNTKRHIWIYLTHCPHYYQSNNAVGGTLAQTMEVWAFLHQICTCVTNTFIGKETSVSSDSENREKKMPNIGCDYRSGRFRSTPYLKARLMDEAWQIHVYIHSHTGSRSRSRVFLCNWLCCLCSYRV